MPSAADDSSIHSHGSTLKWLGSYFLAADQDVCHHGDSSNSTLSTDECDAFTDPGFTSTIDRPGLATLSHLLLGIKSKQDG
jgi:hypothetical protein